MFTKRNIFQSQAGFADGSQKFSLMLFPQILRLSLMTLTSVFVVTVGLKFVQVVTEDYHDPFAPYTAIMPGQPAQNLSDYSCQSGNQPARYGYGVVSDTPLCNVFPQEGAFHLVEAEVRGEVIHSLTFYSSALRLGDIALHWGRLNRQSYAADTPQAVTWMLEGYHVRVTTRRIQYQDSVRIVTIIRN